MRICNWSSVVAGISFHFNEYTHFNLFQKCCSSHFYLTFCLEVLQMINGGKVAGSQSNLVLKSLVEKFRN